MSMLDRLEHNLEAAIAEQQAGRVTREQCVEAMARSMWTENTWERWPEEVREQWREQASDALDAAIKSGEGVAELWSCYSLLQEETHQSERGEQGLPKCCTAPIDQWC